VASFVVAHENDVGYAIADLLHGMLENRSESKDTFLKEMTPQPDCMQEGRADQEQED